MGSTEGVDANVPQEAVLQCSIDFESPRIKSEILWMIVQYLRDEGMQASADHILNELKQGWTNRRQELAQIRQLTNAVLEGDWLQVEKCMKVLRDDTNFLSKFTSYSDVQYAVYRQRFLESVEKGEVAESLNLLTQKLKPVEHCAPSGEFKDLCYFLTTKSVHGLPLHRGWEGVNAGREALVQKLTSLYGSYSTLGELHNGTDAQSEPIVPRQQLLSLFKEAMLSKVASLSPTPRSQEELKVETLLLDPRPRTLPSDLVKTFSGHSDNVKTVAWIDDTIFASGSSDNSAIVWNYDTGEQLQRLVGHKGRIWDLAVSSDTKMLATASNDGTVCLWNPRAETSAFAFQAKLSSAGEPLSSSPIVPKDCFDSQLGKGFTTSDSRVLAISTLTGSPGNARQQQPQLTAPARCRTMSKPADVYSCEFRPNGPNGLQLATGHYERHINVYDIQSQKVVQRLSGHELAITHVTWTQSGNLLISGSKDCSIRFWDANSGVNVKSIFAYLGEATSLDMHPNGMHLLSSSKDCSHRLWDLRFLNRPLKRYRGHQNTFKNIIKANFAGSSLVVSGSENGLMFVWDQDTEKLLYQRPVCRSGVLYKVAWNAKRDVYLACADDCLVKSYSQM